MFPPGQGATIGVDFMIKTVEVENEKVKVYTVCRDTMYIEYFIRAYFNSPSFVSYKFGTPRVRRDFVPSLRVITDQLTR